MTTYHVPVVLTITAESAGQAIAAAFSALTDAFEGYDERSILEAIDMPYLHKDEWTIRVDLVEETERISV